MFVLAAAAAVAALAWMYLLALHGGFSRTDQRLPPGRDPAEWPAVTAVVPARNEAAVLPATLPSLLTQDYPGKLTVVLVDDDSADGTAQVAEKLAAASGQPFQDVIRLVPAGQRPDGWAGKVWAMECGLAAAGQPEYVLFTDADISYAPGTLTALVRAADGGGYGLVSQMALLRTETAWERLIVPAFVYFFAQLYPFRRVNRPQARTAAAAGGCMLVRRDDLAAAGGLAMIRGARIDDVALGRVQARRGALLAGPDHGRAQPAAVPVAGRAVGHGGPQRVHPAALLAAAAGRHPGRAGLAVPASPGRGRRGPGRRRGRRRARRVDHRRRGNLSLGHADRQLRPYAAPVRSLPRPRASASRRRRPVRRDDVRLGPPPLVRSRRRVEGPCHLARSLTGR